jgi:mRNA interferase MazF
MVSTTKAPDRGDVVWLDFDPQAGQEQALRRPALILSPAGYNAKTSLAIVCPITTRLKGYPFEVQVPEGEGVSGAVLADHIKSLDLRARKARYICSLPDDVVNDVLAKLETLLWD